MSWRRVNVWLLAAASARVRDTHVDWARAMLAEADTCASGLERLGWAWGCWVAGLRLSCGVGGFAYAAALLAGIGLMTAFEWSADESRATVLLLGLIALALGALRPRRALVSGSLVGLAVTGVIGFEALSGIRPAYEAQAQTLGQSLHWVILLVPALSAAVAGAGLRRRLRSDRDRRTSARKLGGDAYRQDGRERPAGVCAAWPPALAPEPGKPAAPPWP